MIKRGDNQMRINRFAPTTQRPILYDGVRLYTYYQLTFGTHCYQLL